MCFEGKIEGLANSIEKTWKEQKDNIMKRDLLIALFKEVTAKFGSERQPLPKVRIA